MSFMKYREQGLTINFGKIQFAVFLELASYSGVDENEPMPLEEMEGLKVTSQRMEWLVNNHLVGKNDNGYYLTSFGEWVIESIWGKIDNRNRSHSYMYAIELQN